MISSTIDTKLDLEAVGARIARQRKLMHLTQEDVSQMINKTSKYISEIERGKTGMSYETLVGMSMALQMSIDYILTGQETDFCGKKLEPDIAVFVSYMEQLSIDERKGLLDLCRAYLNGIHRLFKK